MTALGVQVLKKTKQSVHSVHKVFCFFTIKFGKASVNNIVSCAWKLSNSFPWHDTQIYIVSILRALLTGKLKFAALLFATFGKQFNL